MLGIERERNSCRRILKLKIVAKLETDYGRKFQIMWTQRIRE